MEKLDEQMTAEKMRKISRCYFGCGFLCMPCLWVLSCVRVTHVCVCVCVCVQRCATTLDNVVVTVVVVLVFLVLVTSSSFVSSVRNHHRIISPSRRSPEFIIIYVLDDECRIA